LPGLKIRESKFSSFMLFGKRGREEGGIMLILPTTEIVHYVTEFVRTYYGAQRGHDDRMLIVQSNVVNMDDNFIVMDLT
jgi:hypothetical protein